MASTHRSTRLTPERPRSPKMPDSDPAANQGTQFRLLPRLHGRRMQIEREGGTLGKGTGGTVREREVG